MHRLVVVLLCFLAGMEACANSITIETHRLARDDGSRIEYYLLKSPHKSSSGSLLLILQGSDCNSVLHNEAIVNAYRNVLPEADLLLVEKYGISRSLDYSPDPEREDCPVAYLNHDSPHQRLADANQVLDKVSADNSYTRLTVLGGSEGALIANLLAAGRSDINATISFNGGGQWFIDDVLHNINSEAASPDAAVESQQGFQGFAQHIINNEPSELVVSGHGYQWWKQMLTIDQLETLKQVSRPLLIVQSGKDRSVSPEKVDVMIQQLRVSGKQGIDYRFYKDLDHRFYNAEGQTERASVISEMQSWLEEQRENAGNL